MSSIWKNCHTIFHRSVYLHSYYLYIHILITCTYTTKHKIYIKIEFQCFISSHYAAQISPFLLQPTRKSLFYHLFSLKKKKSPAALFSRALFLSSILFISLITSFFPPSNTALCQQKKLCMFLLLQPVEKLKAVSVYLLSPSAENQNLTISTLLHYTDRYSSCSRGTAKFIGRGYWRFRSTV